MSNWNSPPNRSRSRWMAFTFIILVFSICQAPARVKRERSFFGALISVSLVAFGSSYAYYHYGESQKKYDVYDRSAFTANTAVLRKDVRRHDGLSFLGGALAVIGTLGIIVSF